MLKFLSTFKFYENRDDIYSPKKKPSQLIRRIKKLQRPLKYFLLLFVIFYGIYNFVNSGNNLKSEVLKISKLLQVLNQNSTKIYEDFIQLDDGTILTNGRSEKIKKFIRELKLVNPGAGGEPINIDDKLLTFEHKNLIDEGSKEYGCNTLMSDIIGYNRIINDNRSDYCKVKKYRNNLPKVSVVIAFYNDPWSVLLRTVHSVLINSPSHLIEEIILSDDYSDKPHLGKQLDEYIKTLKKVKIIRAHKRMGVVGARVLGFVNAVGPVIVSLDSHVEVVPGWLEPLLDRLKDNPKLLVWPQIHGESKDDFSVGFFNGVVGPIGGMDFEMNFAAQDRVYPRDPKIPEQEPWKSPTLFGPTYALWKDFFQQIGYLDHEFDIWGGDDIELSLKVWLCHGAIEMVPCSVTIHLYRDHRYSKETKGKGGYRWNTDRIVEVWLDDNYKKYYYKLVGDSKDRKYGDVSELIALKEKNKCKNFTWFVDNVHPNMKPEDMKEKV